MEWKAGLLSLVRSTVTSMPSGNKHWIQRGSTHSRTLSTIRFYWESEVHMEQFSDEPYGTVCVIAQKGITGIRGKWSAPGRSARERRTQVIQSGRMPCVKIIGNDS